MTRFNWLNGFANKAGFWLIPLLYVRVLVPISYEKNQKERFKNSYLSLYNTTPKKNHTDAESNAGSDPIWEHNPPTLTLPSIPYLKYFNPKTYYSP